MAAGVVTCQLPNLAIGGATSATITITPGSIGRITHAPTVTTDEVDLTPGDNTLAQLTTVALVSNFDNSPPINVASNGLRDEDGDLEGWIELYNYGSNPVNLTGYGLSTTAGDPGQWIFPATNLAAGQYLVVFASGKDRRTPGLPLHTSCCR